MYIFIFLNARLLWIWTTQGLLRNLSYIPSSVPSSVETGFQF